MEDRELDKIFKDVSAEGRNFQGAEESWAVVEKRLRPNKNRAFILLFGIAGLVILLMGFLWYFSSNPNADRVEKVLIEGKSVTNENKKQIAAEQVKELIIEKDEIESESKVENTLSDLNNSEESKSTETIKKVIAAIENDLTDNSSQTESKSDNSNTQYDAVNYNNQAIVTYSKISTENKIASENIYSEYNNPYQASSVIDSVKEELVNIDMVETSLLPLMTSRLVLNEEVDLEGLRYPSNTTYSVLAAKVKWWTGRVIVGLGAYKQLFDYEGVTVKEGWSPSFSLMYNLTGRWSVYSELSRYKINRTFSASPERYNYLAPEIYGLAEFHEAEVQTTNWYIETGVQYSIYNRKSLDIGVFSSAVFTVEKGFSSYSSALDYAIVTEENIFNGKNVRLDDIISGLSIDYLWRNGIGIGVQYGYYIPVNSSSFNWKNRHKLGFRILYGF